MYIEQAQIKMGYPTSKDIVCNDVLGHFSSYKEYKKARDVYLYYMFLYRLSPLSTQTPVFESIEEYVLFYKFRELMQSEFKKKYDTSTAESSS